MKMHFCTENPCPRHDAEARRVLDNGYRLTYVVSRYRRRPWHERSAGRIVLYNLGCLALLGLAAMIFMTLAVMVGPKG
jgi:hypothetical protein